MRRELDGEQGVSTESWEAKPFPKKEGGKAQEGEGGRGEEGGEVGGPARREEMEA